MNAIRFAFWQTNRNIYNETFLAGKQKRMQYFVFKQVETNAISFIHKQTEMNAMISFWQETEMNAVRFLQASNRHECRDYFLKTSKQK